MDHKDSIDTCINKLKEDKIALIPTDTIWGLSCNANSNKAIERIFEIKNRPLNKPLIMLLTSINDLTDYFDQIPESVIKMHEESIKPTTFILPNAKQSISPLLTSENNQLAFRIPKQGIIQEILKSCSFPLTSTSANFAGEKEAQTKAQVNPELLKLIDYIYPENEQNYQSSGSKIVLLNKEGDIKILRN